MPAINKEDKPMLDTAGQIQHLRSKGVKFERISVDEATAYLRENNNYFKLRAYRKNFPKHPGGEREGQYIDLDFAALRDLAIIDMRMRYTFIQMALDIEHFAKVRLLRAVEDSADDGYQIVERYFLQLQTEDAADQKHRFDGLLRDIAQNRNNPYCGGIIQKYEGCYPIWAFIEIIPLGRLIHFYRFCGEYLQDKAIEDGHYLLLTIKELRNAAAHSNCIIHDMGAKDRRRSLHVGMLRALSGISRSTRDNQLKNERMRQMITLLYAHTVFVSSAGVHERTKENLERLVSRMYRHIELYDRNENILASFGFFQKAVDILFP